MSEKYHDPLEIWVAELFRNAGYLVKQNVRINQPYGDIDIVAEKNNKKYCVEVKYSNVSIAAIKQLCMLAENMKMLPILVTTQYIDENRRERFKTYNNDLIVIDIQNLLFAVQDFHQMKNELVSILPYAVDDIEPKAGFLEVDGFQHSNYIENLIKELEECAAGHLYFRKYEKICIDSLKNIFSNDLALWKEQDKSNKGLYRFDLLCRIKDDNQKSFWSILERYFNSKYVIFEFKNYNEEITQKEIYTTEKYLYAKALRSVAIIVSANGFDSNAYWASKGCLRENGKLIILLTTDDLIEMNKMKMKNDDPSEYLLNKLDELLLELEK